MHQLSEAIAQFVLIFVTLIFAPEPTSYEAAAWRASYPDVVEERAPYWRDLRWCETRDRNITDRGGRGNFHGYYQFHQTSWAAVGGEGHVNDWSLAEQEYRAERLFAIQGAYAWPGCHRTGLLPHWFRPLSWGDGRGT